MLPEAERVHRSFVRTARAVAPELSRELKSVGPLWFPARVDHGLGVFLCRSVIGQQLSTVAARSIWQRVVSASGGDIAEMTAFFTPSNEQTLRACGVSRNKLKALYAIREAEMSGHFNRRRLAQMDRLTRSEHLIRIWGIGPWTCDMSSIFYFKDIDVWPEGDVSVMRTASRFVAAGRAVNKRVARLAAAFAPYRSVLALYMWRILDGD